MTSPNQEIDLSLQELMDLEDSAETLGVTIVSSDLSMDLGGSFDPVVRRNLARLVRYLYVVPAGHPALERLTELIHADTDYQTAACLSVSDYAFARLLPRDCDELIVYRFTNGRSTFLGRVRELGMGGPPTFRVLGLAESESLGLEVRDLTLGDSWHIRN